MASAAAKPVHITADAEKNEHELSAFHNDNDEGLAVKQRRYCTDRVVMYKLVSGRPSETTSSEKGSQHEIGELIALMGPSGSGKTTLLTALARRSTPKTSVSGQILINGQAPPRALFRQHAAFVEQEDTLVGSLTVFETLDFAAKLGLSPSVSKTQREDRVRTLLKAFGLQNQSSQIVGTPVQKGISGGQKRRLSVASQLIAAPSILFLDEPTSSLDSKASFEVISYLKKLVKQTNASRAASHHTIIVASIHQPSTAVFNLFDRLVLLSQGSTAYSGPVSRVRDYCAQIGFDLPAYTNPAESLLEYASTDFLPDGQQALDPQDHRGFVAHWREHESPRHGNVQTSSSHGPTLLVDNKSRPSALFVVLTLMQRSFTKSHRDVLTYGIRLAMYVGLAIMMGTVWLRLAPDQDSIQSFINAIFFGGAFMSFMAVAYIPAYLEDRAVYVKEHANGLYGPTLFMLANFLVGLPFLFTIDVLFSVIVYWLIGFRDSPTAFFVWLLWLYLDLLAAESLVVLISSLMPVFVVALAVTAFANGLWMSVNGFLVQVRILNPFWKYVFHYIDYQAYVFAGMLVNEFLSRTYACSTPDPATCHCAYDSALAARCLIPGEAVLAFYEYPTHELGKNVGIMLAIIAVLRAMGWAALWWRK